MSPSPHLRVELLGPPRVHIGADALQVDTRKAVAILALLAVDGPQTRDHLATTLWPESDGVRARSALRRTLSVLHRGLGNQWLELSRTAVRLEGPYDCDVADVDAALDAVRAHAHAHAHEDGVCEACSQRLAQAIGRHRGPFLDGFGLRDSPGFDDWLAERGEYRRRQLGVALDQLTGLQVAAEDLPAALVTTQRWSEIDRLNEEVHRRLMLLHAWQGQRAEAIRRYRGCAATLDRELGVAPLARTTELYRAILEDRVPPRVPTGLADSVASAAPHTASAGVVDVPFVGRVGLLDRLEAELDVPGGRLLVITGEAGIGKTRVADELLRRGAVRGLRAATARCHAGEIELALGPVVELLREAVGQAPMSRVEGVPVGQLAEIGRLIPDLVDHDRDLPAVAPLSTPGAQLRLFEAVWQVFEATLSGPDHGIVLLDDLHHVDGTSRALLAYGLRGLADRNLTVVVCVRSEDSAPLRDLLDQSEVAANRREVVLDRLGAPEVGRLVDATLGSHAQGAVAEQILRESEGLPLLVVEYLRFLQGRRAAGGGTMAELAELLPRGAMNLARSRLAEVSETAQQVASTAATLGRSFDLSVVLRASGRTEEEAVDGLDELVARHLVRELPSGEGQPSGIATPKVQYDFVHDKVRRAIYEDISLARRRLLHARVADALALEAVRSGHDAGSSAAVIGEHHRRGGRDAEAAEWFVAAGDHARALFANPDALTCYERALALGHPETGLLHARAGAVQILLGDYPGALGSLERAAAQVATDRDLGAVEHELGALHLRLGELDTAVAHLDEAWRRVGDDPTQLAGIAADRALAALRAGDLDRARVDAQTARTHATASGDVSARAQARNVLGLVARHGNEREHAREHFAASVELAAQLSDPTARIAAMNNLALADADAGDLDAALARTREAVDLVTRRGDRHREAALRNNLADLLHLAGHDDEAMTALRAAVTIFTEVGENPDGLRPEIWKLVEW